MRRIRGNLIHIATLAVGLLPALAVAHPGHVGDSSFAAGLLHPLGGLDHAGGFILVGLLAAQLGRRYVVPMAGVLLGLLVTAWTSDGDGWNYAAGFMLGGAIWIAAGLVAAGSLQGTIPSAMVFPSALTETLIWLTRPTTSACGCSLARCVQVRSDCRRNT